MRSKSLLHVLAAISLLLFFPLFIPALNGFQTNISGNIKNVRGSNKYPHTAVTTIPNTNRITISNPVGFATGDTVLVIQMQGVEIYTAPYGEWATNLGQPGLWEFLIVVSVTGNEISFSNNLKNSYDARGNIQLIKVPSFNSAKVTGTLVCDPWDPVTKSGGVLPLIAVNTLSLIANIDVTGSGFRGGAADIGDGICQATSALYQKASYSATFTNAGYKGEGVANYDENEISLLPGNVKGKGKNFTGGGGGNGGYSGGGGGSHRGTGGIGGFERAICIPMFQGGIGGKTVQPAGMGDRIFMGGGGGASTRSSSGTSGPGGNGGGIVIIIADKIIGSGGNILAKGGNGGSGGGSGPSGAGGGGGGGTIALSVQNYSGTFETNLSGGKGGDNTGRSYGEGGGGGAGLVWLNNENTINIIPKLDGGAAGISDDPRAFDGGAGEKQIGFDPALNGLLYNSIRSSVSGNLIDSISSGTVPPKIIGTIPVGGTAPYSYKWEKSYTENFLDPVTLSGGSVDYIPTDAETSTVWFRRKVTDSSLPLTWVDYSRPVKFSMRIITGTEETPGSEFIRIFPNPSGNEVAIQFSNELSGRVEIDVTSLSGKRVTQISGEKSGELFRYTLPVSGLSKGIYQLTIFLDGRYIGSGKIVKGN